MVFGGKMDLIDEKYELKTPDVVPMVALVFGATSPLGARVAACLATHGARLSLVGDKRDKHAMEQVGRLASCLGSPIVDIHEVELDKATAPAAQAAQQDKKRQPQQQSAKPRRDTKQPKGKAAEEVAAAQAGEAAEQAEEEAKGQGAPEEGPPTETLARVAETVLSRQGRVDIIVSAPRGDATRGESPTMWASSAVQQLAVTQALVSQLATVMLAPPGAEHQAVITITTAGPNNRQLRDWMRGLPDHMAAAAAKNSTGTSGPSAEDLDDAARAAAAREMLMLTLVLPEEIGAADMPYLSRAVCGELVEAFKAWRLTPKEGNGTPSPHLHREIVLPAAPTGSATKPSYAAPGAAAPGSSNGGGGTDSNGGSTAAGGVLHTLRGMLASPAHPAQQQQRRQQDASGSTTTAGAETARGLAPAGDEAEPSQSSPSSAGRGSTQKQQGQKGTASEAIVEAAAHSTRHADVNMGTSSSGSGGGGKSTAGLQGVLRAGGGTQLLTLQHEDELLQQALHLLTSPHGGDDAEAAKVQGRDPSPRPGSTCRAEGSEAVWIDDWANSMQLSGILLATGARTPLGLLSRPRYGPGELLRSPAALPGVVLTPADPNNLEPEEGKAYKNDPPRHPAYLVHCYKPFNGETPHKLLADSFLTPAELFYVRNHLPVPTHLKAECYTFELSGVGVSGAPLSISLEDLKAGRWGSVLRRYATLQCAGNRRSEVAAVKLVEGRAPWNHGSIGNAEWTGVELRSVLLRAGLNSFMMTGSDIDTSTASAAEGVDLMDKQALLLGLGRRLHVVMEGWDAHSISGQRFETSISLDKVLDARGGVMLAWAMNGKDLLPDHGFPLRVVAPGYVGTRSVKWLRRITLSESESKSAWQQKDYKLLPQRYTTLAAAKFDSMPPIMDMNTQSAILLPEPGSIIDGSTTSAVWFKGYAWCGAGLPITRVDVSTDEGATWEVADIVARHTDEPTGRSWSWSQWQVPLQVPPALRASGGKWRVCCKAFNANGDTQPSTIASVWNFRGLACNAWHYVDLAVKV